MSAQVNASAAPSSATAPDVTRQRYVELDWLRSLVVLGIVPYHVLTIFAVTTTAFVKSSVVSPELSTLVSFIGAWGIPVLFMMAGAASALALRHRSGPAYLRERLLHIGVPLVLIALVFAPLQAYYILLSNPTLVNLSAQYGFTLTTSHPEQLRSITIFYKEYLTFLVTSVRQLSPAINNLVLGGFFFVPRLLVISFICLPLFLYLRHRGQRWVERLAAMGAHPLILLFGAGLVPGALLAILRTGWLERVAAGWIYTDDWSAFFLCLVLFIYGYLIYSSAKLRASVRSVAVWASVMAALCTAAVVGVIMLNRVPQNDYSPASIAYAFGAAFAAWLPALALLGLAMRYLTKSTPLQRYLTPAAFPVFVAHTPIQAVSAYYVLQLPLPWMLQLAIIMVMTIGLAFAAYEYLLKRTRVTRFLFGIKQPQANADARPHPPWTRGAGKAEPDATRLPTA